MDSGLAIPVRLKSAVTIDDLVRYDEKLQTDIAIFKIHLSLLQDAYFLVLDKVENLTDLNVNLHCQFSPSNLFKLYQFTCFKKIF
jgi:hypothetical protein